MNTPDISYVANHDTLEDVAPPNAAHRLIGHAHATELLVRSADSGHHAIIIEGQEGIGKATAAFLLAKLKFGADGTFAKGVDRESGAHRQIAQGAHPNLIHLTREWSSQTKKWKTAISVDQIRSLQSFFGMTASTDYPRIVIVDHIQDMNRNATNALLKLLEEPPANALFLLISHGAGAVLPTIRSRCQMVRFAPLSAEDVSQAVTHVASNMFDKNQADELADLSGGSVRHALVMGLYGGIELLQAVDRFLKAEPYDTATAHRLAAIVADKKQPTQGLLVQDMLLASLHSYAKHAANSDVPERAASLASAAQDLVAMRRTDEAFNIDAKQSFLVATQNVYAAIHANK
ncbi:MAG: DNA polymerase III subunit delta' [Pseudomonadota bacterium]